MLFMCTIKVAILLFVYATQIYSATVCTKTWHMTFGVAVNDVDT